MQAITIDEKNANQRLDKFLLKYMNKAPKSFIYKMLRKKNIKLNGKKAEGSEILCVNDNIALFLSDETISSFREEIAVKKQQKKPDIIYEDENIIIANKPSGMLVQGDKNEGADNLNDILLYYLMQKGEIEPTFKPGVANRLDRNTGGIVLMGKNLPATQALTQAIRENNIEKHYLTAVKGEIKQSGEISGYHTKDNKNRVLITKEKREGAVPVKTLYSPVYSGKKYSILNVELITGKSHQIRESLNSTGHPIIGDPKYGDKDVNKLFRDKTGLNHQLLYAVKIVFRNQTGTLEYLNDREFVAKPDKTAEKALACIRENI